MKKIFLLIIMMTTLFFKGNSQVNVSISYQNFYDQLSPYGTWVEYPGQGYVWSPNVGPDFRPYGSRGHWVYTDDGWAWVSNYAWGWAPFHYGRWIYDDDRGWLWVPGYDWSPAWVTWGSYGSNYGWAPLGVDFSADYVSYRPPATWWVFVGAAYITSNSWHSHVYGGWSGRPRTTIVNNNITIVNNVTVNNNSGGRSWTRGPRPDDVQKYTHAPIRPMAINSSSRPGADKVGGNNITMYRPAVNRAAANDVKPARTENFEKFRPANRPNTNNDHATKPVAPNTRPAQNDKPPANPEANRQPVNQARPNDQNNRPERPVQAKPQNRQPVNPAKPNDQNNQPERPVQAKPQNRQPANPPANSSRPAPVNNRKPQQNNPPTHIQQRPQPQMKRPANPPTRPIQHAQPPPEKKHDAK